MSSSGIDLASARLPGPEMHRLIDRLREEGPLAPVTFGGQRAWLITTHALLLEGFASIDALPPERLYRISIGAVLGPNFQTMAGEEHRLYRRIATPAFRSRAVQRFAENELPGLAHEVLDRLDGRTEVDLVPAFTQVFPFLVISRLLGVPREREADFHRWAWEMLSPPGVPRAVSERAVADFVRYLAPVIDARRKEPADDVISELVHSEVEGRRLTDAEVDSHLGLMFSAGATTTHDALGSLVHTLLSEGEWWKRIVDDASIRPAAIRELLRYETPVANLPRVSADHEVDFGGRTLAPSTFVLFSMSAANRDPLVFDEPARFDPTRPPGDDLTFGRGVRSCPGMHLAKASLAVGLDALATRLPDLRLLGDPLASAPEGAIVRGPKRLTVALR